MRSRFGYSARRRTRCWKWPIPASGCRRSELSRLFERFYRVEGTHARTHEGSGIGLALVQELVKLHGATIDVTSTLGRGTTFSVRLPFGAQHLSADRINPPTSGTSVIGAQAFVQEALRWLPDAVSSATSTLPALTDAASPVLDRRFAATFGARIILADDNADMRAYVRDLLAPIYAVEAVADGEEVLAAARRQRPDLIISDVMMPRLDGFGLLAADSRRRGAAQHPHRAAVGARRGGGAESTGSMPAPTTT